MDLDPEGEGFIEFPLGRVKAVRTALAGIASKAAVGHAAGLAGEPWAKAWLDLRVELGLNVAKDKCLLPAPSPAGGFHRRRVRSEELVAWTKRHFAAAPGLLLSKQRVGFSAHQVADFPASVVATHVRDGLDNLPSFLRINARV